jgi:acetoin utilization deacetylase AcuC-like enzyme
MGLGRVAILDVDYHHGNGTQDIFAADPEILFVSIHADPATD